MPLLLIIFILSLLSPIRIASHSFLDHVVISEIQIDSIDGTGGTGDDWIELYNPTDCPIPLGDWSIQRLTATGTTPAKKNFEEGASIPAHGYFLIIANTARADLLVLADMTTSTITLSNNATIYLVKNHEVVTHPADPDLVDFIGFGEPQFFETAPAPAPPESGSIERINGEDTDNNAADFTIREVADPQNSHSPPFSPPGSCFPTTPVPTPTTTPPSSSSPTPTPTIAGESVITIAAVRDLPNGEKATVSGVVTAEPGRLSNNYIYIQDETGGLQIYSSKSDFPKLTIGREVIVSGTVSEAYSEKRLKISSAENIRPQGLERVRAFSIKTGIVGESWEGQLVRTSGRVTQTSGDTFFIDDGSGELKIYIKKETGIDKPPMRKGNLVEAVGIISQYREAYRLLPRFQDDLSITEEGSPEAEGEEEVLGSTLSEKEHEANTGDEEEHVGENGVSDVANSPLRKISTTFSAKPGWIKILGWSLLTLGPLLILVPLGLWARRKGLLPARQRKHNGIFRDWPKS